MEKYEEVKELGRGSFGVTKLMRNNLTGELVAVKLIDRGLKINETVSKEIINHRSLRHPNVILFKKVVLTPTYLAIVMEYAAGGNLLKQIQKARRFSEDEARYFFQQLISGIKYCHSMQVSHGDVKLENTLLVGSAAAPRLKICDFGYSTPDCCSLLCCIQHLELQLALLYTLPQRFFLGENTMASWQMYGLVE